MKPCCFNLRVANLSSFDTNKLLNVTPSCGPPSNFVVLRMYLFCRTPPQLGDFHDRFPFDLSFTSVRLCEEILIARLGSGFIMGSLQAHPWKDESPNGFRPLGVEDSFIPQAYTMLVKRLSHSFQPLCKALQASSKTNHQKNFQPMAITSPRSFQWNLHLWKTKTQSHHSLGFLVGHFFGALLRKPKRTKATFPRFVGFFELPHDIAPANINVFRWSAFHRSELSSEPIQWVNLCRRQKETSKIHPGGCMVGSQHQRYQTADHNDRSCLL